MSNITTAERDAIAREDFLAFAQMAFVILYPNTPFSVEWCHEIIANFLTNSVGEKTRMILNAPPRSLKSFLISVAWVAFRLGHEPTHKFICASYSQILANQFSNDCRRIMESEWYKGLFRTRLTKSTEEDLVTTVGGQRAARSVGGTLTGMGGNTLIIDDPLSANDANSDASRNGTNVWFTRTLMTRLNDKISGSIIVVMQRLHQADLTGHLLETPGWYHLVLPAIAQKDIPIQLPNRSFVWRTGEPLQKREPLEVLNELKQQIGSPTFYAHYLQEPVPDKGNDLNPDWLKWYEVRPERQPGDEIVFSCDTAMKASVTSDYSVLLVFLVRNKNEYYLIDVWRGKVQLHELSQVMVEYAEKYRPNAILIEEHALGAPLITESRRRELQGIVPIRPTKDKRSRMKGETGKLQAGSLVLPKSAPWLDEYMLEFLAFPGGKHDDQMDALSQFLTWRTTAEARISFQADFGPSNVTQYDDYGARLGAPSAGELLDILRY